MMLLMLTLIHLENKSIKKIALLSLAGYLNEQHGSIRRFEINPY